MAIDACPDCRMPPGQCWPECPSAGYGSEHALPASQPGKGVLAKLAAWIAGR